MATHDPLLLCIETATDICSVTLFRGNKLINKVESNQNSHAKNLVPFINILLKESNIYPKELNAVAISKGPGSYTGLRIGTSAAKGICYALNIPLLSISTLKNIACGAQSYINTKNTVVCPMIDAGRMEVYTALYDAEGVEIMKPSAVVDYQFIKDILVNKKIIFCGNGYSKLKQLFEDSNNAIFCTASLTAENMINYVLAKYYHSNFEDLAYFEPFYLKNYEAKKSIVKGLF